MKNLLLLRHAKSSWNDQSLPDYQRPLNERGKKDAPKVGEVLQQRDLRPQLVLSSSAKRASKTAKKVIEASGLDVELRLLDELYLAPPETYVSQLGRLPDELTCVLVVGHNPGIEELLLGLTGQHQHFPTAALANVELPADRWSEVVMDRSSRLLWLWKPGEDD